MGQAGREALELEEETIQNAVADEFAVPNVVDRDIFKVELDALRVQEKAHTRDCGCPPTTSYGGGR